MTNILIAVSGGVDSSTAAWFIKQTNPACQAATMQLFGNADNILQCRTILQTLDIPFHVFDFTEEFKAHVIEPFVKTYLEGKTPNPCVLCNRFMKFEHFLRKAQKLGIPRIATGHYAQIEYHEPSGRYWLKKAVDQTKDQSYVLYTLTQEQLAHSVFPLGTMQKGEVRSIAESLGFASAQQRESQDLCFVPEGDYARFIEEYAKLNCPPGNFVDKTGKVLGQHKGLIRYTIGQRKGLGIAAPAPYYVCEHNVKDNTVVLGSEDDLLVHSLTVSDINLIMYDRLEPSKALVKVRYRQKGGWASIYPVDNSTLNIVFDEPQKGVAKGQAAVLYDDDYVIGGGTIVATSRTKSDKSRGSDEF